MYVGNPTESIYRRLFTIAKYIRLYHNSKIYQNEYNNISKYQTISLYQNISERGQNISHLCSTTISAHACYYRRPCRLESTDKRGGKGYN